MTGRRAAALLTAATSTLGGDALARRPRASREVPRKKVLPWLIQIASSTAPVPAVAAAVLATAALAHAATTKRYEGKVKGAGPVSFRLSGASVKRFRASVGVTCASSSGGESNSYLLAPGGSAKVDKRGRFTLKFKKSKQLGGPFPLYKVDATVYGNVSGRSSGGTVQVTYFKNRLVAGRLVLMACGSGKVKWTAKRK